MTCRFASWLIFRLLLLVSLAELVQRSLEPRRQLVCRSASPIVEKDDYGSRVDHVVVNCGYIEPPCDRSALSVGCTSVSSMAISPAHAASSFERKNAAQV